MCLVENNCWHVLNPCIQKSRGHEASKMELNDRLSELPNEVIVLILSFLTTKEVRRTSLISKKWRRWLLGYYPKLNFQGSREIVDIWYEIKNNDEELAKERSSFVTGVDDVMKQHLDLSIDEFRVAFDLDTSYQSRINHWVDFALTKRVKTLELDFQPVYHRLDAKLNRGGLNINCFSPIGVKHTLGSLSLNYVNITSDVVESILLSCPCLENLRIEDSELLTSIKFSASSLKHLDVSYCNQLNTIDISAPNMTFFRYVGQPIELNIQKAVSLSSLFIGGGSGEEITYAFEPMSKYFPQLEVLYLQISVGCLLVPPYNLGIDHLQLPVLTKLKVLDLYITGDHTFSLLRWTPLIEACPILEKLIAKFDCYDCGVNCFAIGKRSGSPLKSLKTFEMFGYCGRRIDIELANFVFENAVNLQQVVVEVEKTPHRLIPEAPIRISKLKDIVPQNVSFVLL